LKRYAAIYIPDVRFKELPVFVYKEEENKFYSYSGIEYTADVILIDKDWMLFTVNGEEFDNVEKYYFNNLMGKIVEDHEINEY